MENRENLTQEELLAAAEAAYAKETATLPDIDDDAAESLTPEAPEQPELPEQSAEEAPAPPPQETEPADKETPALETAGSVTGLVLGLAIGLVVGGGLGFVTGAVPACLILGVLLGLMLGYWLPGLWQKKKEAPQEAETAASILMPEEEEPLSEKESQDHE